MLLEESDNTCWTRESKEKAKNEVTIMNSMFGKNLCFQDRFKQLF